MRIQAKKLQRVEERLSKAKGPFEVFALLLREDSPGKWDVLISADWASADKKAAINTVFDEMRKELTDQELMMLSRIVILDKDSTALQAIHQITNVEHGFAEISDRSIFDMPIKQGYVITSRKEAHNGANMAPGNDAIGIRPE